MIRLATWLPADKVADLREVDTACANRFINGKFDGEPTREHKHWRRMTLIVIWLTFDHLGIPTAGAADVADGPAWMAAAQCRRGPAGEVPAPQLLRLTDLQRARAAKARCAGKKPQPTDVLPDRPLTEIEIVAGRLTVAGWNPASRDQGTITWALAEAGAGAGEIPCVRGTDFDNLAAPTHVQLVGTRDAAARTPRGRALPPASCGSCSAHRRARRLHRPQRPRGQVRPGVHRRQPQPRPRRRRHHR
ncbi:MULTISPECIES: hypothetical protein [unclassified Modestobacter]|uniref:hypothetical protein n=1 Tax=unclassified Modestobacter TaxID=2643866 RepID=UPI0022AA853E|nr:MULTISPECIES: hypothetical protein [unclassified Modestobacter]MCZ2825998.1 hypothetical protein [Modestobacter sp. VKM Ac-2981]MCZ2852937.1 hypothetical protein [Modestobacter sp. VKM Ac-2982]